MCVRGSVYLCVCVCVCVCVRVNIPSQVKQAPPLGQSVMSKQTQRPPQANQSGLRRAGRTRERRSEVSDKRLDVNAMTVAPPSGRSGEHLKTLEWGKKKIKSSKVLRKHFSLSKDGSFYRRVLNSATFFVL